MLGKFRSPLICVWGTFIAGLGINLVSDAFGSSFIDFAKQHPLWISAGFAILVVVTWQAEKDHRFTEAAKHFPPFKEAKELLPNHLDFQEWKPGETVKPSKRPYNKTYIARRAVPLDADPDIELGYEEPALRRLLREGRGFVFVGQPGAGKTRTLFSLLHFMNGYMMVQPKIEAMPPESAFTIFRDRRVVLFFNDLEKYKATPFDPHEFYKKLQSRRRRA